MARQVIDLTTPQPGGRQGEPTASAWQKVNDMTAELYASPAMNGSMAGKNMLINCGVPINQRVFAGGALAVGVYGYDRWRGGVGGGVVSINSTTGLFTHTSGNLQQVVENPQFAWGQPLTFSVENPTSNLTIIVGNVSGSITAGSGRRGVTLTPTGSGDMIVQIGATGATYSRPQLERGSSATAFDARPVSMEIILCQRYYEKSYNMSVAPGTASAIGRESLFYDRNTTGNSYGGFRFKVQKRGTPTVTLYNDQNGTVNQVASINGVALAASVSNAGECGASITYSTAASQWGASFHWVANAEI